MTRSTLEDRLSRVADWERLALAGLHLANKPREEAPAHLLKFVEWADRWPWPQPSDTRCRAYQAMLKVVCLTRPGNERASLSPILADLANLVLASCRAVRAQHVVEDARRAPAERRDIYG